MDASNDFIQLLPLETTRHILSFLDSRSLLACSCLSKTWYDTLNRLCPEIWFQACLSAGIYVSKDKYSDVRKWKSFLHKMVARKRDILKGKGFEVFVHVLREHIKAVYIHNGKIAVAFSDRIDLWTYNDAKYFKILGCHIEPFILKFDDSIMIAASEDGRLSSWSLADGKFLNKYPNDDGSLTSFHFLTDCDTLACSFYSISIRIWSIYQFRVTVRIRIEQGGPIVKVFLVPDPNHSVSEERKRSLLFSMTMQNVVLSKVELKYCASSSRYSFSFQTTIWLSFFSLEQPLDIRPTDVFSKNHGGFLFDGDVLYILPPVPTRISCTLFKWKLRTQQCWSMKSDRNIVDLLGIGETYIAYRIRLDNDNELIVVGDKFDEEAIATIKAPRRRTLLHEERNINYIENDYMCLGDTAWLDGLNGENDFGNVYMSVLEDKFSVGMVNFTRKDDDSFTMYFLS